MNYSTQLQSLLDRQATLQEEASSRRRERDHVTSRVQRAEKQLNAIQREEDGLLEQLKQLQGKLQALKHHKEEYVGEYQHLQEEQKAARDQATLVERTLESLGEEIDKVSCKLDGGCSSVVEHWTCNPKTLGSIPWQCRIRQCLSQLLCRLVCTCGYLCMAHTHIFAHVKDPASVWSHKNTAYTRLNR